MKRYSVSARVAVGAVLAWLMGTVASAQAQVHIDVHLPGPPGLVAVPVQPDVSYAPSVNANYFFYDGRYYVFTNGGWYVARGYNGPWAAVAPAYVPRPLLRVPVQYYHRPPGQWKRWQRAQAPRWERRWGERWVERRHEGQAFPRERWENRAPDRRDWRDRHDDRRDWRDRHDDRR
jgi:hypothetical protein